MSLGLLERRHADGAVLSIRTAAWYGDRPLDLRMPIGWSLGVHRLAAAGRLDAPEIRRRLAHPLGQPRLAELARGRSRPLVIVDDLNRPTPAHDVAAALLDEFRQAGIDAGAVTFLMAPGTHGAPDPGALARKVGPEVAAACRMVVHDCRRDTVRVGRTSEGTVVEVNREVAASDLVVGVGGLYPNQTAGFGGGTKLALGVLSFETIRALHYGHQGAGWGTVDGDASFRRELDEVAAMIGLRTSVVALVGGEREIVDLRAGDSIACWEELIEPARRLYRAPGPGDADVVISNAYPNDLSVTFVVMKGIAAFDHAAPAASRIAIAGAAEGVGLHQLFPIQASAAQRRARRLSRAAGLAVRRPGAVVRKVVRRATRAVAPSPRRHPAWLYVPPGESNRRLPLAIAGMRVSSNWDEIVAAITAEQGGRRELSAVTYACAPLQWLDVSR